MVEGAQIRRADTISNNVVNDTKHILGHNNGITLESSMTHRFTASWNSITQLEVGFSSFLASNEDGRESTAGLHTYHKSSDIYRKSAEAMRE